MSNRMLTFLALIFCAMLLAGSAQASPPPPPRDFELGGEASPETQYQDASMAAIQRNLRAKAIKGLRNSEIEWDGQGFGGAGPVVVGAHAQALASVGVHTDELLALLDEDETFIAAHVLLTRSWDSEWEHFWVHTGKGVVVGYNGLVVEIEWHDVSGQITQTVTFPDLDQQRKRIRFWWKARFRDHPSEFFPKKVTLAANRAASDRKHELLICNQSRDSIFVWVKASASPNWETRVTIPPQSQQIISLAAADPYDIAVRYSADRNTLNDRVVSRVGLVEMAQLAQTSNVRIGVPADLVAVNKRVNGQWAAQTVAEDDRCLWRFDCQGGKLSVTLPQNE